MKRCKNELIGCFMATLFWTQPASAQIDYCLLSEKSYDIHIFGESYGSADDRSAMLRGLDKLIKNFSLGDEIRWISHSGGRSKVQKTCVPGCPDQGMLSNFLDATCSVQVAKRDNKNFIETYKQVIVNAFANVGNEYSVISDLRKVQDYYQTRDASQTEAVVFHSTVPYETRSGDKGSFDKAFVHTVQTENLNKIKLDNILFVNSNQSELVRQFWTDLELEGHSDGLNVKIAHITME